MAEQQDKRNRPHVVVVGEVIQGFRFVGPFPTMYDAGRWGDENCKDEWTTAPLIAPADWR